jgi:predicted phage tail protein
MSNNTFQAVIFANPFDISDKQQHVLTVDNKPLSELFATVKTEIVVIINGEQVNKEDYAIVTPKANDLMIVATVPAGGGDDGDSGKQVLRLVATVALMYFTMGTGGLGAGGLFATGGTFAAGGALAASAVFIGGTLLLNSMIPMQSASMGASQGLQASPSQTYGIDGPKNTSQNGIPVPITFGQYRVGGNIIASHTENLGDRQMYHGLYNFGEGEIGGISDVRINDQPSKEFENTMTIRKGTDTQATIPEFSHILTMIPQSISMSGATDDDDNVHIFQTHNEVVRLGLDFTFPRGLYKANKNGTTANAKLSIELQYRLIGETQESDWTIFQSGLNKADFDLTGVNFTIGEYQSTPGGPPDNSGRNLVEIFPLWLENTDFIQNEITVGQDGNGVDIVEIQGFNPDRFDVSTLIAEPNKVEKIGPRGRERVVSHILKGTTIEGEVETIGESYKNGFQRRASTSTKDGNFYLLENEASPFRITVLTPALPKNKYEIRIARLTPKPDNEDPDRDFTTYDTANLTDVREYKQGTLRYIHTALLGLSVMITDKINSVPNVTAVNHGVKIKTFERDDTNTNLFKEVKTNSSNPAWIAYNLYTNKRWGAAYPQSRFALEEFVEWAEFCEDNNLEFNGVIDNAMNIWEAIKVISRVGRAVLLPVGTRVGVNIFQAKMPSQLFNNSNILEGSTKLGWLPLTDRANAIDCVFYDRENDNVRREFRYHDTSLLGNGKDNQIRAVQMDLFGVVDHAQAVKECILALNTNKLSQTISFDTFTNGIAVRKGDAINIQHDMPQWGFGGRIESGTLNSVILDRKVEMDSSKEYALLLSYDALSLGTGTGTAINVGSAINVTTEPPASTKIVIVDGYGEFKVNHIHKVNTSEYHLLLENAAFVNGESLSVDFNSTDVLITRDIEVNMGETNSLTIKTGQPDFPVNPSALMTFSFGEKTKVIKPFTVTAISGSGIDKRTVTALEYSASVYDDTLTSKLPNFSSISENEEHVTNLITTENLIGPSSNLEYTVEASWDYIDTASTRLANVYVSYNEGLSYTLFAEKVFANATATVTNSGVFSVTIKVVALKSNGEEFSQISAPTASINLTLITKPLPVKSVTSYVDGSDLVMSWEEGKKSAENGNALLRYDVYVFSAPKASGITPDWKRAVYVNGVVSRYDSDYVAEAQTFEKAITVSNVTADANIYVAIVAVNAIDNAKFSTVVIHQVTTPSEFSSRSGASGIQIWYSETGIGDPDSNIEEWSLISTDASTHQAVMTWKDFVYSAWFVSSVNSLDIIFKGEFSEPPSNPSRNWTYKNTNDNTVYIFDGSSWQAMLSDGIGSDGESIFVIFHSASATSPPNTPTKDYALEGWYDAALNESMWMAQKISKDVDSGTWGIPIKIGGVNGEDAVVVTLSSNHGYIFRNNLGTAKEITANVHIGGKESVDYANYKYKWLSNNQPIYASNHGDGTGAYSGNAPAYQAYIADGENTSGINLRTIQFTAADVESGASLNLNCIISNI